MVSSENLDIYYDIYLLLNKKLDGLLEIINRNNINKLINNNRLIIKNINKKNNDSRGNIFIDQDDNLDIIIGITINSIGTLTEFKKFLYLHNHPLKNEFLNILYNYDDYYYTKLYVIYDKDEHVNDYINVRDFLTNRLDYYVLRRMVSEIENLLTTKYDNIENMNIIGFYFDLISGRYSDINKDIDSFVHLYNHMKKFNVSDKIYESLSKNDENDKFRYGMYVEMLNKARSNRLISALERRTLSKHWMENEEERDNLFAHIFQIISN